jgi:hypothetical protein
VEFPPLLLPLLELVPCPPPASANGAERLMMTASAARVMMSRFIRISYVRDLGEVTPHVCHGGTDMSRPRPKVCTVMAAVFVALCLLWGIASTDAAGQRSRGKAYDQLCMRGQMRCMEVIR